MMEAEFNHLNHATWECKYHVVFTPKYRKKLLFGKIKRNLGQVFHDLARRKECRIEEGHLMPDHVHMLISIPPKYSVAQIIGYMKGKSSIWIAQNVERKMRNFWEIVACTRVLWSRQLMRPCSAMEAEHFRLNLTRRWLAGRSRTEVAAFWGVKRRKQGADFNIIRNVPCRRRLMRVVCFRYNDAGLSAPQVQPEQCAARYNKKDG
jgi:REP element-mobilizing transposase RayT